MSCKKFIDIYDTLTGEQKEILFNLYMTGENHDGHSWVTYGNVEEAVAKLIIAERKTGKWIEERTYMECPICHDVWHYEKNQTERFKYCPQCGAKMEGAEE